MLLHDESGRRRPVPMKGSEFVMEVDTVIVAISNKPNPLVPRTTPELQTTKWGTVVADPQTMQTSIPASSPVVTSSPAPRQ